MLQVYLKKKAELLWFYAINELNFFPKLFDEKLEDFFQQTFNKLSFFFGNSLIKFVSFSESFGETCSFLQSVDETCSILQSFDKTHYFFLDCLMKAAIFFCNLLTSTKLPIFSRSFDETSNVFLQSFN